MTKKKRPADGYVNTEDPLHRAIAEMTVQQLLQMANNAMNKTSFSAQSPQPDDLEMGHQQSMADAMAQWHQQTFGTPSTSPEPASSQGGDPSNPLSEIMQAGLSKSPELAAKQRRLLQVLKDSSSPEQPTSSSAPSQDDETEEDGIRAEALRRLRARRMYEERAGQTPASSPSPTSQPPLNQLPKDE